MNVLKVAAVFLGVTVVIAVPYSRFIRRPRPIWQSMSVASFIGVCYMLPLAFIHGHPSRTVVIVLLISGLFGGAAGEVFVRAPRTKRRSLSAHARRPTTFR